MLAMYRVIIQVDLQGKV